MSSVLPQIGASPDAVVYCDCCSGGLAEVTFLSNEFDEVDGHIPKQYLYQMQCQLLCLGPNFNYCDYVVLSNDKLSVKRVYPDQQIQDEIIEKSCSRSLDVTLPELLSKYYSVHVKPRSRKRKEPEGDVDDPDDIDLSSSVSSRVLQPSAQDNTLPPQVQIVLHVDNSDEVECVCFCDWPRDGPMIKCDGDKCLFEWSIFRVLICLNSIFNFIWNDTDTMVNSIRALFQKQVWYLRL